MTRTPLSELAHQADLPPRDVLDLALEAGVTDFRRDGERFRAGPYLISQVRLGLPVEELTVSSADAERVRQYIHELSVKGESYAK